MICPHDGCRKETSTKYFSDGVGQCEHCHRIILYEEKQNKNRKKGFKNDEEVIEVAFLQDKNMLYEIVYDDKESSFISMIEGCPTQVPFVYVDDVKYVPANNNALKEGAVLLPTTATEYESEEKLVEEIQKFIYKYLDVSPDFEVFASYYVLLSWVYDALNTVPYLRALGDFSTGKSRLLDVVGKICYRPIVMAGTITPAPLYRLQSFWKGTVLIDEADRRRKSDESDEITKILNCGFERGKPVMRCDKDNPNDIEIHDAFGPKVICSRFQFSDSALESRCLTENMKETERKDIPIILPPVFFEEQKQLRNKLLMFRLKNLSKIDANQIQRIELGLIENRLKQALSSFAVLFATNDALLDKFRAFVIAYQQDLIREREGTLEGLIVNRLLMLQDTPVTEVTTITASEIAAYLQEQHGIKITASGVGRILKALGIKSESIKGTDGKTRRLINLEEKKLNKLGMRYNVERWLTATTVTAVTSVTNTMPAQKITAVTEVTPDTESMK